jgi:hypothetical protein
MISFMSVPPNLPFLSNGKISGTIVPCFKFKELFRSDHWNNLPSWKRNPTIFICVFPGQ